jgi:hypothetical protein
MIVERSAFMNLFLAHLTGGETSTLLVAFFLGVAVGAVLMGWAHGPSRRASRP